MVDPAQPLVQHAHHQMIEGHVQILGDLHAVDGRMQGNVRQLAQLASAVAGQANDAAALLLGILHCVDDIFGIAAAGNGQHHVAGPDVSLELESENLFKADIVGYCHHGRYIVVQAQKIEFLLNVLGNALIEIVLEMRGRGGAAAVAKGKDRVAVFHGLHQQINGGVDLVHVQLVQGFNLVFDIIANLVFVISHLLFLQQSDLLPPEDPLR